VYNLLYCFIDIKNTLIVAILVYVFVIYYMICTWLVTFY